MLIDTQQVDAGQLVRSDLCLIGAGAAGITIARRLRASGLELCLLEAGGLDLDLDVQDLYAGLADGTVLQADSAYLTRSRLRYFGGSTNHWTGYCRPLDDIDFTVRPWVPNSGWPLPKSALEAYHEEAAGILQVPVFDGNQDEGVGWDSDTVLTVLLQGLGSRARIRWVDLVTRPIRTPCGSAASARPRRPSPSIAPVPVAVWGG